MKYEVLIRWNNPGPAKYLMASESNLDLNSAFTRADAMLKEHTDCFAQIVESDSNEVVATIH
jgi:hypothetical protein